jgi:hypothetical protein
MLEMHVYTILTTRHPVRNFKDTSMWGYYMLMNHGFRSLSEGPEERGSDMYDLSWPTHVNMEFIGLFVLFSPVE